MTRTTFSIVFTVAVCLCASTLRAAPKYSITDLTALGAAGGYNEGDATAINNSGQVVGYAKRSSGYHAVLFSDGEMTDIGTLGGTHSLATAINDRGQVVGWSYTSDGKTHGFLYGNNKMIDLGTLGGDISVANAINALGEAVGESDSPQGGSHAFLYSGGATADLGTIGGRNSNALAINKRGQIVGSANPGPSGSNAVYHAFLYSDGTMRDLGTLGGTKSYGYAINDHGNVVGASQIAGDDAVHAMLYAEGALTDLGTLGGDSFPSAINNRDQVVGYYKTDNGPTRAFLYADGEMVDLFTLIDPQSGWSGLWSAHDINDRGQIVGVGFIDGRKHAFLLTPIPEGEQSSPLDSFPSKPRPQSRSIKTADTSSNTAPQPPGKSK